MTHTAPGMVESQITAQPRTVLVLVVLATTLANLEVGLVNVALPTLATAFDAGPALIQWVAIVYQLAIVGTLVLFGRLVDLFGGRPFYLIGMVLITLASLAAVVSPNAFSLILARGVLGVGASMLLATGQALLVLTYPDDGRGRALGVMHMAVAAGLMAGPSIGGVLVTTVGWRAIFVAPIPLALAAFWWAWKDLPALAHHTGERIDVAGAALILVAASVTVFGLTRVARTGWDGVTGTLVLLALLAVGVFIVVEYRHDAPLIDLSLLRCWSLSGGLLAACFTFIALASNMFLVPFALQDLMGHSAAGAGLIMMAVPLAILPVAPLAGALADRVGARLPTTVGLVAIVTAIGGMAAFQATSSLWFALAVLVLYGIGAGLFQAPNNRAVLGSVQHERTGTVSGMLALVRNLGQIVGVAIASTIWTWRQTAYERLPASMPGDALALGLRDAFLVLAGFGVLALLVSALRTEPRGVPNVT